jgi:hypothetical protein
MITSLQMQDLDNLSIRSSTTSAVPKVKKREEELHVHFSESGRTGSERASKWNSVDASGTETLTGSMNDLSQKNVLHRSSVNTEQQRPTTTPSARKGSNSRYYEECSAPSMINQQIPGHHGSSSSSSSSSSGPPRHPYSSEHTPYDEKSATSRSTMNDEFSNDGKFENNNVLPNVLEESFNAMLMAWYQSGYATGRYQALLEQSMKSNNSECDNHTQQPSYHNQHQNQNNQSQYQPPHPPYFDNNNRK